MSEFVSLGQIIEADFGAPPFFDHDPGLTLCRGCRAEIQARLPSSGAKWLRPELCAKCRDDIVAAEGHEKRSAQDRRAAVARRERCGIPRRYAGLRLSDQVLQDDHEPLEHFRARCGGIRVGVTNENAAVIEELEAFLLEPRSLHLMGSVGSGKSHLAAALAGELALGGTEVWFCSLTALLELERRRVDDRSRESAVTRACEVPFFVLDDFGSNDRMTEWAVDQIETVVSRRYDALLPLVLTSNQPFTAITGLYGQRVHSRLCEMVGRQGLLKLGGPDWRLAGDVRGAENTAAITRMNP